MDIHTISVGLGLVVSLLFTEVFGLACGGMIVPGYVALSLHRPVDILVTLGTALATFALVRGFSKFALVYGRRRIVMMVLVGFLIGSLVRAVPAYAASTTSLPQANPEGLFSVIGYIIPGLIALWIDRQGLIQTIAPLMTSAVVVRLALIILGMEIAT
jgi:poly-gamma-glutamate biosynthesis protein PgsC/CapC